MAIKNNKNIKNAKTTNKNYFFNSQYEEREYFYYEEMEASYYREMIDKIDHPCYDGITTDDFLDDPESIRFIF